MKNTFLLFLLLFSTLIYSQSVTIDITKSGLGYPSDYYRKDINNLLNPFEGTYVYTSGNIVFKIVLEKKIKQPNGLHYNDLILGEYQLIENGAEKINTLSNLNVVYVNQYVKHAIAGSGIIQKPNSRFWDCPECNPNEKRFSGRIIDRISGRYADMLMRRTVVNGQEVLQVKIYNIDSKIINENNPEPPEPPFALPKGIFTMIKQ